jgi:hypothetical protein
MTTSQKLLDEFLGSDGGGGSSSGEFTQVRMLRVSHHSIHARLIPGFSLTRKRC